MRSGKGVLVLSRLAKCSCGSVEMALDKSTNLSAFLYFSSISYVKSLSRCDLSLSSMMTFCKTTDVEDYISYAYIQISGETAQLADLFFKT